MAAQRQKKKVKYRVDRIVICALIFLAAAAGIVFLVLHLVKKGQGGDKDPDTVYEPDSSNNLIKDGEYIDIELENCSLYIGTTLKLSCTASSEEYQEQIVWRSTKPEVVAIEEDGTITVLSEGTAVITAVAGVLSDSLIIQAIDQEETEKEPELPIYQVVDGTPVAVSPTEGVSKEQEPSGQEKPTQGKEEIPTASEGATKGGNVSAPLETTAPENPTTSQTKAPQIQTEEERTVKEQLSDTLSELGFDRYVADTFIYREDGNYLGEVIVEEDLVQIYLKMRTSSFDQTLKSLLQTLLPNGYETAYANMLGAQMTQTFRIDGRKVQVIPAKDSQNSHTQLIIYY